MPGLLSATADELLEQNPELRLRLIPNAEVHRHHRSHRITAHGGYEVWRLFAVNERGDGLCVAIANGDPLAPDYRAAVRDHRAGLLVDTTRLRPSAFPVVRISVYRSGVLLARGADLWPPNTFREEAVSSRPDEWAIAIGGTRLERTGSGWSLIATVRPAALGRNALRHPGPLAGAEISCELHIAPASDSTTMQRAALPDSPSGASHDWLLTCPMAHVSGRIRFCDSNAVPVEMFLDHAPGLLDQLWGTGLFAEGIRRWYRAVTSWEGGTAIGELVIIRKFIQLAGTIMIFRPNRLPVILRTERLRPPAYERSHWLIAYPLELQWFRAAASAMLQHRVLGVPDSLPHRVLAWTEARLEAGQPPDELLVGPMRGWFELLQPGRVDASIWRPWVGPWER